MFLVIWPGFVRANFTDMGQSCDCFSAIEATLNGMGEIDHYQNTTVYIEFAYT